MIINITQTDSNLSVILTVPGSGSSLALPNAWLRAQIAVPVALVDGPAITLDLTLGNNFFVTLGGNRTIQATHLTAGQAGQIVVTQGSPGGFTLTYASQWKFRSAIPPVLSTVTGGLDILSYYVVDASHIAVSAGIGFA